MSYAGRRFEAERARKECPYCGGDRARIFDAQGDHPVWSEMTGVSLWQCRDCGSQYTDPPPTDEFLSYCYARYAINGYPATKARARGDSRQDQIYGRILEDFKLAPDSVRRSLDIGAGEAHLTLAVLEQFPGCRAEVVDFSTPPAGPVEEQIAAGRLRWTRADINAGGYGDPAGYDLITAAALIEHVKQPLALVERIVALLREGGRAFVLGPRAGSPAQRLFRKSWVYHIPGEHLSMPSAEGIRRMMERLGHSRYRLRRTSHYYSTKYLFNALTRRYWKAVPDVLLAIPAGTFTLEIWK